MKRTATQGTWKTPPNMVWAAEQQQQQQQQPPPPPSADASASSSSTTGTKMQLMGLPRRIVIPTVPTMLFNQSTAASASAPAPQFVSPPMQYVVPPPADLLSAPAPAPPAAAAAPKRRTKKQAAAAEENAASPSPAPPPADAKEDKQKTLEHSRTMARLRRQQQRALTDSLEGEFFELNATAAYLRQLIQSENPNAPLPQQDMDRIVHSAFEAAVAQLTPHIPTARAQEMKNLVQNVQRAAQGNGPASADAAALVQVPLAHQVASINVGVAGAGVGTFLAVTQGSRREAFSFSPERKRSALLFALEETRGVFQSVLDQDVLPLVQVLNQMDLSGKEEEHEVPALVQAVRRFLAVKRAGDVLLCPGVLAFPKTESMVEQFRDTCNADQINKLLQWSVHNEAQMAMLKFTPSSTRV